jgi:tetratricopeptide (TPR) repeat protein
LLLVLLTGLALLASSGEICADELQRYELAKSRYDVGSYDEAVAQFAKLLDQNDPGYLVDAKLRRLSRPLYAASLIAIGRVEEADRVIAVILREEPTYRPEPGLFPQQVTDRFIAVRAQLRDELETLARERMERERKRQQALQQARAAEAQRIVELERLAAQETVVVERSRWIALVPFGVGQFQNDADGLGWFFAISEALAVAGSIASAAVAFDFAAVDCRTYVDPDTGEQADCGELESSFTVARTVNWVSFGSAIALALAGIIEAQISFVPQTTSTRKRELPPKVRVTPQVEATDTGAALGIQVRF